MIYKASKIIKSCKTTQQILVTSKYLLLLYKLLKERFGWEIAYSTYYELYIDLNDRLTELSGGDHG